MVSTFVHTPLDVYYMYIYDYGNANTPTTLFHSPFRFQSRRCASSLLAGCLSSPSRTALGTKKQPMPQKAMRGTMMMKTARMPFIFASASTSEPSKLEASTLLPSGRAESVTAYCTAVLTAKPVTAPSILIRLRVDVATARSSGLQRAWRATRATLVSARCDAVRQIDLTWLMNEANADSFDDKGQDFRPHWSVA